MTIETTPLSDTLYAAPSGGEAQEPAKSQEPAKAEEPKAADAVETKEPAKEVEPKVEEPAKEGDKAKAEEPKADDKPKEAEPFKLELDEKLGVDEPTKSGIEGLINKARDPNSDIKKDVEGFVKSYKERQESAIIEAIDKQIGDWNEELRSDKEFGGVKFDENVKVVQKVVDRFGGKELKEELEKTGMGSNPKLVKALYNIGKIMSEDKVFRGGDEKPAPKALPDLLYNNSK